MSVYVHHLPGRVRLRASWLALDADRRERVVGILSGHPGVRRVEVNPRAGSITVLHDPAVVGGDAIHAVVVGEAPPGPTPTAPPRLAPAVKLGTLFGRALLDAMLNKGVERSVRLLIGR